MYEDFCLGKPSKKTTKLWTSAKRGGVSSAGKLFNEEKFGHVFRGGGQRDSSKVVFVKKKVCIEAP